MTDRTDTERLEWIAKQSRTCTVYIDGTALFRVGSKLLRGETFQEAIDTAMDAEKNP